MKPDIQSGGGSRGRRRARVPGHSPQMGAKDPRRLSQGRDEDSGQALGFDGTGKQKLKIKAGSPLRITPENELDVELAAPAPTSVEFNTNVTGGGGGGGGGGTGPQGPQGKPGKDGDPGPTGLSGPPGRTGEGDRGRRGPPGADGARGGQGIQGPPARGMTGDRGPRGRSIPGTQGVQGTPGSAGAAGSVGFPIPGRDGDRGRRGFPGGPGVAGAAGSAGSTGATGAAGADGRIGPRGRSIQGPRGRAMPGPKGDAGAAGSAGSAGSTGAQGIPGLTFRGRRGDVGPRGRPIPGARGSDGADGAAGSPGAAGAQGIPGLTLRGRRGADGARARAIPGARGIDGVIGVNGSAGPMGPARRADQGPRGRRGPPGAGGSGSGTVPSATTSVEGTVTLSNDLEYTANEVIRADDIRITTSLFKKRQMQMLARFGPVGSLATIDAVGMKIAAMSGNGKSQIIPGTTYCVIRFLADGAVSGTGTYRQYLELPAGLAGGGLLRTGFDATCIFLIQTGVIHTAIRMWLGLTTADLNAVASPTAAHVCAFRYDTTVDTGTTNWRAVTSNGVGGVQVTDTGVNAAVNATGFRMIIQTSVTTITFYINDVLVATHSTSVPANVDLGHTVCCKTLDATNKRIEWGRSAYLHSEFGL